MMNLKLVLILVVVSAIVVSATEEKPNEGSCGNKDSEKDASTKEQGSCKKKAQESAQSKEELIKICNKERKLAYQSTEASIETCVAEYSAKNADKPPTQSPNDCIARCVLDAEITLNEKGLVTQENLEIAVKQRVTGDNQQKILKKLSACNEKLGTAELLASTGSSCGSYENLALCMKMSLEHMCASDTTAKDEL